MKLYKLRHPQSNRQSQSLQLEEIPSVTDTDRQAPGEATTYSDPGREAEEKKM